MDECPVQLVLYLFVLFWAAAGEGCKFGLRLQICLLLVGANLCIKSSTTSSSNHKSRIALLLGSKQADTNFLNAVVCCCGAEIGICHYE